jgi:HK97 family phage portal protein
MNQPTGASAPGLMARVYSGLRYAVTGAPPQDWFGPAAPMSPEAPPSVAGRQFDYPVAVNLSMQPRAEEWVSFAELRGLAERWDLLRLVIETRKDQIESLDWAIQPRKVSAEGRTAARSDDPRIAWLEAFLRFPDREHGWGGWLRMLLEDLFVIDAPTLHIRRDRKGGLWALEVMDGATVKRVLASDGRTPLPPDPAYQQVLKGVPAVDYTAEELIYAPRNPRPHKIYGLSPVEQIVMTANIALRRQVSQLNYFTEGNTPEALIGVPDAWTPDQIRQFQEYWDALLQGNLGARRHTRFVPGGLKYQPMREPPLKDEFDEWLARVVCFAFSIPPTAFSTQTNRATAETAQQAALAEGLAPLQRWLKALIDRVIGQVLGWQDLEFAWADTLPADPAQQAQILTAYVAAGIKTRNEARAQLGLDPVAGGDVAEVEAAKPGLTEA